MPLTKPDSTNVNNYYTEVRRVLVCYFLPWVNQISLKEEKGKKERGTRFYDFKPICFPTLHFKYALSDFQTFPNFNHTFCSESVPNEREHGLI